MCNRSGRSLIGTLTSSSAVCWKLAFSSDLTFVTASNWAAVVTNCAKVCEQFSVVWLLEPAGAKQELASVLTPIVSLFATIPAATSSHCICLLVEGGASYRLHQQLAFVLTAS